VDNGEFLVKRSFDDDLQGLNISQQSEVHTALLQMISRPRHEAEAYFPAVPRLGMSGAVPPPFLSAFVVWGGTNLVHSYLITLSVASMAVNDGLIGK
jgi:hypothetical protein